MNSIINIRSQNGQAVTDSRGVAQHFDKQHSHVLRSVDILKKDISDFGEMFFETEMPDSYGRMQRCYLMNRDGFSILAMSFTGKKALEWKLKYIEAFNRMEAALREAPSAAYISGCARLINTIRRVMKSQNSPPYKIAMQTKLLCRTYGVPLIDRFIESAE